jgi:hypothetical protein
MGKIVQFRVYKQRLAPPPPPTRAPAPRPAPLEQTDPRQLHHVLPRAASKIVTFRSERELERYRRNLYAINQQGEFRYRTIRDENSSFGVVIWRTK